MELTLSSGSGALPQPLLLGLLGLGPVLVQKLEQLGRCGEGILDIKFHHLYYPI